ncbi:MAG: ABC transporter ATP-binding protein [Egibacteraceae bacterium]
MSSANGGQPESAQSDGGPERKPVTIYDLHSPEAQVPLRRLPEMTAQAVRLVWAAAPGELLIVTGLQAVSGLGLVVPILAGRDLLATVAANRPGAASRVVLEVAIVLIVGLLVALAGAVANTRDELLSERVALHAEQRILDVTCTVELEAFETPAFHDRLQRASMSASYRPYQLVRGLVALSSSVLGIAGVSIALVALQPLILPLTLLAAVPLWIAGVRRGQVFFNFFCSLTPAERERGYLLSLLTGRGHAKEVRALGLAGYLRGRWEHRTDERLAQLRSMVRTQLRITLIAGLASALAVGAALVGLLALALSGRMSLPDTSATAAAVLVLGSRLRSAAFGADLLFLSAPFVQDLTAFLASTEAREPTPEGPSPAAFERLVVEDATFTYPSGDRPALEGVSLELRAGEVIALVGENGSGKTTLAKLLCRLYRPQSGRILWDGVDVAELDPHELRQSVAVLFQDYFTYLMSAADNIAVGHCERATDRAGIVDAAVQAGADEFLTALPGGYDSLLGPEFEGGTDLSVGQWQRVALARAFFRDAPFVILDEPTAALDARAEHKLFAHIRTLFAGRTVLLISHRFSTVRSADRIYVLADGRLAEHGTHTELMALGGHYAELFTLQASSYVGTWTRP